MPTANDYEKIIGIKAARIAELERIITENKIGFCDGCDSPDKCAERVIGDLATVRMCLKDSKRHLDELEKINDKAQI